MDSPMKTKLLSLLVAWISVCGPGFAQTVKDLIEKAEVLALSQRYPEAVEVLKQASNTDKSNAKIHYLLGTYYLKLDSKNPADPINPEAIKSLERAVEIDQAYEEAWELLANLYSTPALKMQKKEQRARIMKSVESYEKAYNNAKDPEIKLSYKLQIINQLFGIKSYKESKPHLDDALKLSPNNSDLKFMAAQYYNVVGAYAEAIKMLQPIVKELENQVNGNEMYFYELGVAYNGIADYKKADETFAVIANSRYKSKIRRYAAETYLKIAEAYFDVLEYSAAKENLMIAVKKKPDLAKALELQSKLAKNQGGNFGAQIKIKLEEIKVAEAKDPGSLSAKYDELANMYYLNGDYALATEAADEFLKKNQSNVTMLFLRGACEYQLKKPDVGATQLEAALKSPKLQNDAKGRIALLLSMIYRKAGEYRKAASFLKYAKGTNYQYAAFMEREINFRLLQGGDDDDDDSDDSDDDK
jgi:tetratricopeptide (TPR) repeat protein